MLVNALITLHVLCVLHVVQVLVLVSNCVYSLNVRTY